MIFSIKTMKSNLFILSFLLTSFTLFNNPVVKWQKEVKANLIKVDQLGKIYQIADNSIIKYDANGKKIVDYSYWNNGSIYSIDTKNALQTIVFYKDQQQITLLDNMLAETNKLALGDYFEWIDLVCFSSRDNAFWMYSINNQSLLKVDRNLEVINEFENIGQLLNLELNPTQLFEKNETIYLFDPSNGLLHFDIFGNFIKKTSLKDATMVKLQNNSLVYANGKKIQSYNLQSFDHSTIYSSKDSIIGFDVYESNIYLQTLKSLTKLTLE